MNLQENILRIKEVMGLLSEQSNQTVEKSGSVPITSGVDRFGNPIDSTDYDMVHGWFGSKRLDDDLEQRVSDKLSQGNYKVEDVIISTEVRGNNINTKGTVYLRPISRGQVPDKYFTTRGSIGPGFAERHDTQVSGLPERLKNYYKSNNVKVFGPFVVDVRNGIKYKQSFFAIEGPSTSVSPQNQSQGSNTLPNITNNSSWISCKENGKETGNCKRQRGFLVGPSGGKVYNDDYDLIWISKDGKKVFGCQISKNNSFPNTCYSNNEITGGNVTKTEDLTKAKKNVDIV